MLTQNLGGTAIICTMSLSGEHNLFNKCEYYNGTRVVIFFWNNFGRIVSWFYKNACSFKLKKNPIINWELSTKDIMFVILKIFEWWLVKFSSASHRVKNSQECCNTY